MTDQQLERLIQTAYRAILSAATPEKQQAAFRWMCELVNRRSPTQIERMERKQGLR